MLNKVLTLSNHIFEKVKILWESKQMLYVLSVALVFVFLLTSALSFLVILGKIDLGSFTGVFRNPFFSIEVVFTLLLIAELFSLIFVLPKSVAKSVGKQFELLSLIFLRDGFKEFSHIGVDFTWETIREPFINMTIYGFGAIAIFAILGFTYNKQKHIKLVTKIDDQTQFVRLKKLLALLLLLAFIAVGVRDVYTLIVTGKYLHSFTTFYTVLIFSDIVIVLIALRYTLNYYKIFRYSAFVLATILIRIALSAPTYYDVIIGVVAVLFVMTLTLVYNHFLEKGMELK